jgi:hypothetical protein
MRNVIGIAAAVSCVVGAAIAQERPVPKDSARISIPGCATGTRFIVGRLASTEVVRADIAPGRRFRLNGPRQLMADIKKQQGMMIEVTGLVRQADLAPPTGVNVGGVRVSPGQQPGSSARANAGTLDPVMDVESFRPLAEACPKQ